jgi:hypothetical protein
MARFTHGDFSPTDRNGDLSPRLAAYALNMGAPLDACRGNLRTFLAWVCAAYIGTTPFGERFNRPNQPAEPTDPGVLAALERTEREYHLYDEVLPPATDENGNRRVDAAALLLGTAWPSRMRWAHAFDRLTTGRIHVLAATDRPLSASGPDELRKIAGDHDHCRPIDPEWKLPSKDQVLNGTEADLGLWITQQSPANKQVGEIDYIDATSPDPTKRASTDDTLWAYIEYLARQERFYGVPEGEYVIAVVSSCPHWIFQAFTAERIFSQAMTSGRLHGAYRLTVLAYPLHWGRKDHVYVAGGLFRAALEWAKLYDPTSVPSNDEVLRWAKQLDQTAPKAAAS